MCRKETVAVGGIIGGADGVDPQLRVDIRAAACRYLRLGLAHRGAQGVQLAVDVGDGYGVLIHQRQLTHAAAGQALRRVAANAAQTEYDHVAAPQPRHSVSAQQHLRPQKGLVHGVSQRTSCRTAAPRQRPPPGRRSSRCNHCWTWHSPRRPARRGHPRPQST